MEKYRQYVLRKVDLPISKMQEDVFRFIRVCHRFGEHYHMTQSVSQSNVEHPFVEVCSENWFFEINTEMRCLLCTSLYPFFGW